jgi:hypothetical protein
VPVGVIRVWALPARGVGESMIVAAAKTPPAGPSSGPAGAHHLSGFHDWGNTRSRALCFVSVGVHPATPDDRLGGTAAWPGAAAGHRVRAGGAHRAARQPWGD